jgi:hypothetical protein
MKKCPICELNFIQDNAVVCKICYAQTYKARELVKHQEIIKKKQIEEEKLRKKQEEELQKKLFEKQNKQALLDKLYSYGFEGFLHTANINNFISIYKTGYLYSREELTQLGIPFEDNAMKEIIDGTSDFIRKKTRFYYRPITPTNVSAYKYYKQTKPVLMVFDPDLIFDSKVYFSDGCARAYISRIVEDPTIAIKYEWDKIFDSTPLYQIPNEEYNKDDIMHYRNAEFLYPHKVSTDKIIKIYFKRKADMDYAISQVGNDPRFVLDNSKFYGDYYDTLY